MNIKLKIQRVIILLLIGFSVYKHFQSPQTFASIYDIAYPFVFEGAKTYNISLPIYDKLKDHWITIAYLFGFLEGICGILFLFGYSLGVLISILSFLFTFFLNNKAQVLKTLFFIESLNIELNEVSIILIIVVGAYLVDLGHEYWKKRKNKKEKSE